MNMHSSCFSKCSTFVESGTAVGDLPDSFLDDTIHNIYTDTTQSACAGKIIPRG